MTLKNPFPGNGSSPCMTLRDWFAGQALVGIMTDKERLAKGGYNGLIDFAWTAYNMADAMLAAREGKEEL